MSQPFKPLIMGLLLMGAWLHPAPLLAADLAGGLPPEHQVIEVLTRSPAYQAARQSVQAEKAVQTQYQLGAHEWTASASAARRKQSSPTAETTMEWELGLDRPIRLPGKAQAHSDLGQARSQAAQAMLKKTWREQGRLLLERYGQWLREREAAVIWSQQVSVLQQQAQAVDKRQRLGDAARIDHQLAAAALLQAQAQRLGADSRVIAARQALQALFPGLDVAGNPPLPAPQQIEGDETAWLSAIATHNPELASAQQDALAAQAQTRVDTAETRPDPSVGVRYGRARDGAEAMIGLVLSVPLGGDHRAAVASASASRQAAAQWAQTDAEQRAQAEGQQRWREAISSYEAAVNHTDAAQRLNEVATGLARGYQLGEGSLSEVLAARRLANEQQLLAAMATVDAWLSRHRLALEADRLWSSP